MKIENSAYFSNFSLIEACINKILSLSNQIGLYGKVKKNDWFFLNENHLDWEKAYEIRIQFPIHSYFFFVFFEYSMKSSKNLNDVNDFEEFKRFFSLLEIYIVIHTWNSFDKSVKADVVWRANQLKIKTL